MKQKDIIQIFPSMRKNNRTVRVLKEPKTDSSIRKVYIPSSVAILLAELREEQNETIEALGDMYENYNLVMATSYGLPLGESYLRDKMQEVIDREGLPDVVFHSLRHTSVTYKLKLSGGDIKAVQGDSGHAQADMVTEVYGHILDEDRKKNAQLIEDAFYKKENLNPDMKRPDTGKKKIEVPDGIDAEALMKVLNNPEKPEEGVRRLPITREVWIERDDFMLDPPKKYFRLAPGRTVRLRGGYCITCTDYKQDAEGTITEIFCEHIPGTIGSNPPEGIQCRAAIHWVSAKYAVDGEIRIYDRLFTEENPDAAEEGFLSVMNPSSLAVITNAKLEPSLAGTEPEFRCQFERLGYFVADRRDHVPGRRPVFNRTVALKDSWAKKQK